MVMFDDKVGGWGWLNADMSKKYTRNQLSVYLNRKKSINRWVDIEEMIKSCLRWV